jgi:cytochrome P450
MHNSDTTANTLANALFYLAKHQEVQSKLRSQLSACVSNDYSAWEYARVKTVSFLDNIIDETLRLKPPVIQGLPRETPAQGLHLGDVHIPGHVVVSVPTILIQRDPRWWQQPNDFIPERWGEQKKQMGTGDSPWIPFQLGKAFSTLSMHLVSMANYDRYAHVCW